jgi:hypothetical protein
MKMIFAAHFAGEIDAVSKDRDVPVVRERVAALDEEQREPLRDVLDAVVSRDSG